MWNASSVAIDDCLYARGDVVEDNALAIDRLWVDIQSFPAEVAHATNRSIQMILPNTVQTTARVIDSTYVETSSGDATQGSAASLREGDDIQVVGFGDPFTDSFTATRVLLFSTPEIPIIGAPEEELDPVAPDDDGSTTVTCPYTYKGLTSWFCCGGVTGCGAGDRCPSSTSGGACGGCRSDRLHMAWPKLTTGCGPFCTQSCATCIGNVPRLRCGKNVHVKNPCNENEANVEIRDCGPRIRCADRLGCKDYQKQKFDLTPCAFTRLHGDLSDGRTTCHATVQLRCCIGCV